MDHVYKTVSNQLVEVVKSYSTKEIVQKWLTRSINDPIVKILSKNSNMTRTQLECLLIDFSAQNIASKPLTNEEKSLLRLSRSNTSRGSFNRTLRQARVNIIQSIYTVILMGYLGVFDDTRLTPYLEVANKLKEYVSTYQDTVTSETLATEHLRIFSMLRSELEASLEKLSNAKSLSKM